MNAKILNRRPRPLSSPTLALLFASALPLFCLAQSPAEGRLDGTAWVADDGFAGGGVFELRRGGVFLATSRDGVTRKGKWEQRGSSVHIRMRGGQSEKYSGVFEGVRLEGTATDKAGRTWRWAARRQEATPVASSSAAPTYPPIARAARAQGLVIVEVKVDEAGRVSGASPVGGHALLQQAATEAAKRWQFNPDEGAATRTALLFFEFRLSPAGDCEIRTAHELISAYQLKVQSNLGCVQYSAARGR